jgi:hypothetical protein
MSQEAQSILFHPMYFEPPGEPLKTASGYIVPLPNNQFMYTNIVILLTILYQSFIIALYYCKLFGIKIYVLCLMSVFITAWVPTCSSRPWPWRHLRLPVFNTSPGWFHILLTLSCETRDLKKRFWWRKNYSDVRKNVYNVTLGRVISVDDVFS